MKKTKEELQNELAEAQHQYDQEQHRLAGNKDHKWHLSPVGIKKRIMVPESQ
ncbi:MAG: hypothetical protein IKH30_12050 [Clostridia bacterium]|nr:hypothetical protein [Clostridia bacterium]